MRISPSLRPATALFLAAFAWLLPGCARDNSATPAADAAPVAARDQAPPPAPAPVSPEEEAAARLFVELMRTPPAPAIMPAGFRVRNAQPEAPSPVAKRHGGLGKMTYDVEGPHDSTRISYTLYPTADGARGAFGEIGNPVEGRQVIERAPLQFGGFDGPTWGEQSREEYLGSDGGKSAITRTTVATVTGAVVALSQVIVSGEPSATASSQAIELLRVAVKHAADASAAATAAAATAAGK